MQPQKQDLELPLFDPSDDTTPRRGPSPLHWGLLLLAAAKRRKLIAFSVFLLGMSAVFTFYKLRTPMYRVETRLLAQRQTALPSIVQRSVIDEQPTRAAWELVHRRENLLNLIKQANLPVASFENLGEPNLSLKILKPWASAGSEDDPLNRVAMVLDKSLLVLIEDNTITLRLDWPDPEEAYELVQSAQQNFLESRHVQEITALGEVIALMEQRAASLREQLEATIAEVQREAALPSSSPRPVAAATRTAPTTDEETVRLRSALEAKERAILDLEDMRRRRLADLQAQLAQMRTIYSEEFPAVVSLRKEIASLSAETPQLTTLRAEEAQLRREYNAKLSERRRHQAVSPASVETVQAPRPLSGETVEKDERVREARARYQQMLERVTAAHVDFDSASAAFKHRYKVLWPAQMPKKPVSPNPMKILGAGALASLLFALFVAAFPDIRTGRILTRWQLERALSLPILATVRVRPQLR